MKLFNDSEIISAGEVNRYTYCPYQWYYERLYGKKYISEKKKALNKTLGIKVNSKNKFTRGVRFHNRYLFRYRLNNFILRMVFVLLFVYAVKNLFVAELF